MSSFDDSNLPVPVAYDQLLAEVKATVRDARVRAARVVNVELIELSQVTDMLRDASPN